MKRSPAHIVLAFAACLTVLLLGAAPVLAATAKDDRTPLDLSEGDAPARDAAAGSGGGGIVRMVVGLAVVIGVIYGLSWVLKQVKASKEGSATGAGLAPISSLPLGPGRSVHLVRVGTELVLLGSAEQGVTPIRTYAEHEARAAGLLDEESGEIIATTARPARPALPAPGNVMELLRQRTVRR